MGEAGSPAPSSPRRKKETQELTSLGLRAKRRWIGITFSTRAMSYPSGWELSYDSDYDY